jgi:protein-disulfide isomerase/uncharacterized membrane protein
MTQHKRVAPSSLRSGESAAADSARPWMRLALVALASGFVLSSILAFAHLRGLEIPGCGGGSPCGKAAASPLGTVPILGWPTPFLGIVYFACMGFALAVAGGSPSRLVVWCVRLGAIGSVFLLGAMAGGGYFCLYCAGVHAASIAAWGLLERAPRPQGAPGRWQNHALVGSAMVIGVMLGLVESGAKSRTIRTAEERLEASTREIVRTVQTPPAKPDDASSATKAFEGRYRRGPAQARVRVVIFTDYQCPDCAKIEKELDGLFGRGLDMAVSVKQFPLNSDCNPHAPGQFHANACWAARAAEAAGLIGGPDGFWRMHAWLFDRGGAFTDMELDAALPVLGFDRARFISVMTGSETLSRVQADVAEGMRLGIFQTPMIFINGVELKGWNAPAALTRAVEAALASAPAAATAEVDVPPTAAEKFVADWRESPRHEIPEDRLRHTIGPADAPVRAIVIGDYQERYTADADALMRVFAQGNRPIVRYSFVQFPVNQTCNPSAGLTVHDQACIAAKAAEAAGVLDGPEGFWRMHDWLLSHQGQVTRQSIIEAAVNLGFDAAAFAEAMEQPFVGEWIEEDGRLAQNLGIRAVPMVFIDGRHAARWTWEGENVLARMIAEAAGSDAHPTPEGSP